MWIIFCIFASDLGIVPVTTNSYQQVMNNETIGEVRVGNITYKTNALLDEQGCMHGYRILKNGHIASGGSMFADKRFAVMFMLRKVFSDVAELSIEFD